tara:strand:- start:2220 stop:3983 length:1764 start_codon:yes stop_codon:yes gene_type:complete
MTTSFPAGLDALTNPTSADGLNSPDHAGQHANVNDAVEALEAKVGVNSSAVVTSLDYKVTNGIFPALAVDTNVLVVDATNNRVGVNTASPVTAVDVIGTATVRVAATQDGVALAGRAGGTGTYEVTLTPTTLTADRILTLPDTAGTVVTTGDTGSVTSTMILDGTILNADINASAAIVDTKLATIATASKVSNSATTATSANTASAIVARDASGNFTAGTITSTQFLQGTDYLSPYQGFRNKIINGDMRVDQRNSASTAVTTNAYSADRWYNESGCDAVLSAQQSTDVPTGQGFAKSLKITSTTADTSIAANQYAVLTQHIEGNNFAHLAFGSASAKQIVVSFWVKATVTGTYSFTVHNNGASRLLPTAFTISASNTWEKKTVVIAGDTSGTWLTDTGRGLSVNFYTALGSNYLGTSGVWNGSGIYGVTGQANAWASVNNVFAITGVQLEQGSVATPFEQRPIGTELALCQRYYWRNSSSNAGSVYALFGVGQGDTTTNVEGTITFPVTMRTAPTSIETTATAANYAFYGATVISALTSVPIFGSSNSTTHTQGVSFRSTSAATVGRSYQLLANNNNTAYIGYSAEF